MSSVGTGATGYSAAYDAAGEMTCRAVGASTCTGATPTGQALGYDALRRLISWQNASTSPTATGAYAYDGGGSRVWQQDTSTSGGVTTTTTTTYILGFAEITSVQVGQAAASTTATRFYPLPGGVSALRDAAGLSYVASDQLGTPIATLNLDTGAVLGEQLRAPYGQARYAANSGTNGGMRTTYGFTGQREDATAAGSSGLDYFHARYYDTVVSRFTSPDDIVGTDPLLDGYAYVGGSPETVVDPTGHMRRPQVSDPDLRRFVDDLWRWTASFGDGSAMWALIEEARTGVQTWGRWHYNKVWDTRGQGRGLAGWIQAKLNRMEHLRAYARTDAEVEELMMLESDPDMATAWGILGYMNRAIDAWERSPYHTGIPGQNPFVIAPSLGPLPGFAPTQGVPSATSTTPVQHPPTPPSEGIRPVSPGVQRWIETQPGFQAANPLGASEGISSSDVLPGIQRFADYLSTHWCWGCTIAVALGAGGAAVIASGGVGGVNGGSVVVGGGEGIGVEGNIGEAGDGTYK